jgi:hypothetical protein
MEPTERLAKSPIPGGIASGARDDEAVGGDAAQVVELAIHLER